MPPNSGLCCLTVEVSRSNTVTHNRYDSSETSDQLVAEDATYTTHNKHKRRTFMPSAGFEPAIPALERPQMYGLDRTATGSVSAGIYYLHIHGRRRLRSRPLKIYTARSSKNAGFDRQAYAMALPRWPEFNITLTPGSCIGTKTIFIRGKKCAHKWYEHIRHTFIIANKRHHTFNTTPIKLILRYSTEPLLTSRQSLGL